MKERLFENILASWQTLKEGALDEDDYKNPYWNLQFHVTEAVRQIKKAVIEANELAETDAVTKYIYSKLNDIQEKLDEVKMRVHVRVEKYDEEQTKKMFGE